MKTQNNEKRTIQFAAIIGLWGIVAYYIAITTEPPPLLNKLNGLSLGFLFIIGIYGLFTLLKAHLDTFSLRLGLIFSIFGGMLLTVMLSVQYAAVAFMENADVVGEAGTVTKEVYRGLTFMHLGLDIA